MLITSDSVLHALRQLRLWTGVPEPPVTLTKNTQFKHNGYTRCTSQAYWLELIMISAYKLFW
jgi:hypothetical protein